MREDDEWDLRADGSCAGRCGIGSGNGDGDGHSWSWGWLGGSDISLRLSALSISHHAQAEIWEDLRFFSGRG